jgi:hypothetical protein
VRELGGSWEVTSLLMRTSMKNEMKRPVKKTMTRWMPPIDRRTGEKLPQQELFPRKGIKMRRLHSSIEGDNPGSENDSPTEQSAEGLGAGRPMSMHHPAFRI